MPFPVPSLPLCFTAREGHTVWTLRKGWEENRLKHTKAISCLGPQLQRQSLSSRHFKCAHNYMSIYVKFMDEFKCQKVWGLPKELSWFNRLLHLHASSSVAWFWPSLLRPLFLFLNPTLVPLLSPSNFPPLSLWRISKNVSVSYVCPPTASDLVISTVAPAQHQISTSEVIRRQDCLFLSSCFQNTFPFFYVILSLAVFGLISLSESIEWSFPWWHENSSVWIWLSAEKKRQFSFEYFLKNTFFYISLSSLFSGNLLCVLTPSVVCDL